MEVRKLIKQYDNCGTFDKMLFTVDSINDIEDFILKFDIKGEKEFQDIKPLQRIDLIIDGLTWESIYIDHEYSFPRMNISTEKTTVFLPFNRDIFPRYRTLYRETVQQIAFITYPHLTYSNCTLYAFYKTN